MDILTILLALQVYICLAVGVAIQPSESVEMPELMKKTVSRPFNGASSCHFDWKKGYGGGCGCWADGYGIDRSYLITAITHACEYFNQDAFSSPNNSVGLPAAAYFAAYHTVTDPADKGVILVSITYYGTEDDQAEECAAKTPIQWTLDFCWNAMHAPIDQCNQGGENGKQGGWGLHQCMIVGVDPNPHTNQPEIMLPPSWDPVVFTY